MTGTIAVIVPSFNRPRMLREALASIDGADQVIVADDGSDFDVRNLAVDAIAAATKAREVSVVNGRDAIDLSDKRGKRVRLEFVLNQPRQPAERMVSPSCGLLLNRALRHVSADHVAYLCDDDLMAPGWLQAAAAYLDAHPASHMVRGDWYAFSDGQPLSSAVPAPMDAHPPLTTGNFVHRTECAGGCGCWWSEETVACHDAAFLDGYLRKHGSRDIAHVGVLAGYRREHPYNMLKWLRYGVDGYRPEAEALFAAGSLEVAR